MWFLVHFLCDQNNEQNTYKTSYVFKKQKCCCIPGRNRYFQKWNFDKDLELI